MAKPDRALERDASYYLVGKACAALGVFAAIPLATRGLDVAAFAEFAVWSAGALWCSTAAMGWLQSGIGRFHRERRGSASFVDYVRTVRLVMRVGAVASAAAVSIAAAALSDLDAVAVLALGVLTPASTFYLGHQSLVQADLLAGRVVRGDIARGLVLPLALVLATALGVTSVATVALAHAVGLLAAVVVLAHGRRDLPRGGSVRLRELVPLARYGVPVGLWLVTTLANAQIGRVVLDACDMPEDLALFAALHEVVVKAGTLVLMPVVYATQSHVMAAWADGDRRSVRRSLRRAFLLQLGAGIALAIGFALGADVLVMLLFGEGPPGGAPLPIAATLGVGVVLANLGLLAHKGLELGQRTLSMLGLAVAAVVLGLVLCVALVPILGALGAALAWALAQAFYAATAYVCSRRVLARLGV